MDVKKRTIIIESGHLARAIMLSTSLILATYGIKIISKPPINIISIIFIPLLFLFIATSLTATLNSLYVIKKIVFGQYTTTLSKIINIGPKRLIDYNRGENNLVLTLENIKISVPKYKEDEFCVGDELLLVFINNKRYQYPVLIKQTKTK